MGTLARIVLALALAVGGVVGVAYLLPGEAEVRVVSDIGARPDRVYAVASDLGRFGEWTPWPEFAPGSVAMLTGVAGAVGQTLSWSSADRAIGSGALTLTALDPGRQVGGTIEFDGAGEATIVLTLEPTEGGSRAVWAFIADLGDNPLARYMWVLSGARATVEGQLASGLDRLADVAEPPSGLPPSPSAPAALSSPIMSPLVAFPFAGLAPLPELAPLPSAPPGI